jgi:hypothetical protein
VVRVIIRMFGWWRGQRRWRVSVSVIEGVSLRDNTVSQKASTVPFSYSSDHKLQFYIFFVS